MLTREYVDAREVINVCAGCGGSIHGKEYWQEAEYTGLDGTITRGYKLTSEWKNQFKITPIIMSTTGGNRSLKRAVRCLDKYIDSKFCWAVVSEAVLTTKQIQLLQRGADWMTPHRMGQNQW